MYCLRVLSSRCQCLSHCTCLWVPRWRESVYAYGVTTVTFSSAGAVYRGCLCVCVCVCVFSSYFGGGGFHISVNNKTPGGFLSKHTNTMSLNVVEPLPRRS